MTRLVATDDCLVIAGTPDVTRTSAIEVDVWRITTTNTRSVVSLYN